ncbi:hypothetical protein M758_9G184400 [Ceratodon purpureus]|nr:hypothetical protein M758_9G184400 [Ceratodon purpureus]
MLVPVMTTLQLTIMKHNRGFGVGFCSGFCVCGGRADWFFKGFVRVLWVCLRRGWSFGFDVVVWLQILI